MTLSVGPIEAIWILVNTVTFALTLSSFVDARADREAVRLLNGHARELAATGLVRREGFRLAVQLLLLAIAVPGVFVDREIALSPVVAALMAIALILLASSYFDARDRKAMTVLVAAELLVEATTRFDRLEAQLAQNTEISQQASEHADAAYKEANDVNRKIASQGAVIIEQGEDAQRVRAAEAE